MKTPSHSIRVKITPKQGSPWWASAPSAALLKLSTPQQVVDFLNEKALTTGVNSRYELATEADYIAYQASLKVPS